MNDFVKKMLDYNRAFVEHGLYEKYTTTKYPDRKIAILACMDTRMTELLPAALGLKNGDVKLIKNAGGRVMHPYGSVISAFWSQSMSWAWIRSLSLGMMIAAVACLTRRK